MPPSLGVLAMARNECPSYPEWLTHHREQGVDRFFLIDNNSSDRRCHGELQRSRDVTLWHWMGRASAAKGNTSNQADAYNFFLPNVTTDWVAIIDIDEYMFGANETLLSHLHRRISHRDLRFASAMPGVHVAQSPPASLP